MHDLVIRGAQIVDGSGDAPFVGDVAVKDGKISAVGVVSESGREEIDAKGAVVTPGFVDIHTHYDGQATWDPYLTPSSLHGVTSIVFGNCGVGFALVAPSTNSDTESTYSWVEVEAAEATDTEEMPRQAVFAENVSGVRLCAWCRKPLCPVVDQSAKYCSLGCREHAEY